MPIILRFGLLIVSWISWIFWDTSFLHFAFSLTVLFYFLKFFLIFLFSIFFVYIPNDFPFPGSPLPICLINLLLSIHSPITSLPFFSVLVIPYNAVSSLSRTRVLSFLLLGNDLICELSLGYSELLD